MSSERRKKQYEPVVKFIDLIRLVRIGSRPVVVFNEGIESLEGYTEPGMLASVTSIVSVDWDEPAVTMTVDYSEFDKQNRLLESEKYHDAENCYTSTARKMGLYTQQETLCLSIDEEIEYYFKVQAGKKTLLYDAYLRSGKESTYLEWLENRVFTE